MAVSSLKLSNEDNPVTEAQLLLDEGVFLLVSFFKQNKEANLRAKKTHSADAVRYHGRHCGRHERRIGKARR